jgi:hypothetical protein
MNIVDEHHVEVGVAPVCSALDVSRATWYRCPKLRRMQPRRIDQSDRQRVLEILCAEEFTDCSPRAVDVPHFRGIRCSQGTPRSPQPRHPRDPGAVRHQVRPGLHVGHHQAPE